MRYELVCNGAPCTLRECPVGLFVYNGVVCMKVLMDKSKARNGLAFSCEGVSFDEHLEIEVQPMQPMLWRPRTVRGQIEQRR